MFVFFSPKIMGYVDLLGEESCSHSIIFLSHILTLLSLFDFLKMHPLEIPTDEEYDLDAFFV